MRNLIKNKKTSRLIGRWARCWGPFRDRGKKGGKAPVGISKKNIIGVDYTEKVLKKQK